jgi:hypothetical protein
MEGGVKKGKAKKAAQARASHDQPDQQRMIAEMNGIADARMAAIRRSLRGRRGGSAEPRGAQPKQAEINVINSPKAQYSPRAKLLLPRLTQDDGQERLAGSTQGQGDGAARA